MKLTRARRPPARDPCVVLAPAFELRGTAHWMKATNKWEILVPPTSREYIKVLPAPCPFYGATIEHETLQSGWARGGCSSMREPWTLDSLKIGSESCSVLRPVTATYFRKGQACSEIRPTCLSPASQRTRSTFRSTKTPFCLTATIPPLFCA